MWGIALWKSKKSRRSDLGPICQACSNCLCTDAFRFYLPGVNMSSVTCELGEKMSTFAMGGADLQSPRCLHEAIYSQRYRG